MSAISERRTMERHATAGRCSGRAGRVIAAALFAWLVVSVALALEFFTG
jgi:hypothetical protein